jgi:large conductance mechanosensitive channel
LLKDFKAFLMQGSLIDLAVAFVIGAAFSAVVTALVTDLITPIIAAIGGQPDFNDLRFTINDSTFKYGHFINQVIAFAIIAAAIFFLVVKPVQKMKARETTAEEAGPSEEERRHQELVAAIKASK